MDTESKPKPDPLGWKEFFRPVPIARVSDHPGMEVLPATDTEPVVAICRFRSP